MSTASARATVNPGQTGTKCSFWYQLTVEPGSTAQLRLRLRPAGTRAATRPFGKNFSEVLRTRESEADEFYQELTPRTASDDEAKVMRQAFAGMLWSKQLFYYDVKLRRVGPRVPVRGAGARGPRVRQVPAGAAVPGVVPASEGLDNIGPLDRSHLPVGGILEQSDATSWMGFYTIAMGTIAMVLNRARQRPISCP